MERPCHILEWCPYGPLVEGMILHGKYSDGKECNVFGHDCPAYLFSEDARDDSENYINVVPRTSSLCARQILVFVMRHLSNVEHSLDPDHILGKAIGAEEDTEGLIPLLDIAWKTINIVRMSLPEPTDGTHNEE